MVDFLLKSYADTGRKHHLKSWMAIQQQAPHAFADSDGISAAPQADQPPLNCLKFHSKAPPELAFSLMLDATGVIPCANSIAEQIEGLRDATYTYHGDRHAPNLVDIWLWDGPECKHLLFGRTVALNLEYTLFSPDGTPLRAKVELRFQIEHFAGPFDADLAAKPSLDLTHIAATAPDKKDTLP